MKKFNALYLTLLETISNSSLLVVDIQPANKSNITFNLNSFATYISSFATPYVLFNGESLGLDSKYDVKEFYEEHDIDTSNMKFFEKEYGFFRDITDSNLLSEDEIIKLARLMIDEDIIDLRDLEEEQFQNFLKENDIEEFNRDDYSFYLPDDLIQFLKKIPTPITLIGGACNECLLEIELLLQILDIPYKKNSKFIY